MSCALSVSEEEAERALQIIESHRDEVGPAPGGAVRQRARAAGARDRLPLPRSRPARARADAPLAGARGCQRRRHRQRVARVPRRLGPRVRHRRHAVPAVPAAQRRAEVEAEGVDRVGDVARRASGETIGLGELPDPRTRRGKDRRTPASTRSSPTATRRSSRRSTSTAASSPRAASSSGSSARSSKKRGAPARTRPSPKTTSPRCRSGCSRTIAACRSIAWRPRSARRIGDGSRSRCWSTASRWRGRKGRARRKRRRPRRRRRSNELDCQITLSRENAGESDAPRRS